MEYTEVSRAHDTRAPLAALRLDYEYGYRANILCNLYAKLFDVAIADTPALREAAHRIRYKVFCQENVGYEDPDSHPEGLESDAFDSHAEHAVLIYKPEQKPIGTLRVIKPNKEDWRNSFPLQNICDSPLLHSEPTVRNACEISRLCISSELREIMKRQLRAQSEEVQGLNFLLSEEERPFVNIALAMAPVGLLRGMCEILLRNDMQKYFGVMEQCHLNNFLKKRGIDFEQIGPEMEYHGVRVPFHGSMLKTFDYTVAKRHDVWKILTDNGRLHRQALRTRESVQ